MKNSDCFKFSVLILSAFGMWIPDSYRGYPRRLLYCCYAFLLQGFMFFAIIIAEIAYLLSVIGDTKKSVDAMVLMLSHLVQGVKMITIWGKQQKIQDLIIYIDGPTFNKREQTTNKMIETTIKYGKLIDKCIFGSVATTVLFWITVPFLKSPMSLPLYTFYPFEFYMTPRFQIMYIYNSISVAVVGIADGAMNYLVAGLMMLAGAHLDVLVYELEHIVVDEKTGVDDKVAHEKVLDCLKYHQSIIRFEFFRPKNRGELDIPIGRSRLSHWKSTAGHGPPPKPSTEISDESRGRSLDAVRYVEEISNIFDKTIFCQFTTSSIVICLTVYKITLSTEPIEFITMVFYLMCIFMELLMYCYPGDLVLNKSLAVSKAAYSCDWVSCDLRTQRLLLLVAGRGQRALVTRAGGVYPVSLPTAAAVVQTAYSYYAMLKQTESH